MEIIHHEARIRSMEPNYSINKTEVLIMLAGKNSNILKSRIYGPMQRAIDITDGNRLRIVERYGHLGGVIASANQIMPELAARTTAHQQALAPLRKHILRHHSLTVHAKQTYTQSNQPIGLALGGRFGLCSLVGRSLCVRQVLLVSVGWCGLACCLCGFVSNVEAHEPCQH